MNMVNVDQQYKEVARTLFNICRGNYDPSNYIGVLGFFIAVVKQGRYNFSEYDNFEESIRLELDDVNRIGINDVSNIPVRREQIRAIIHTITSITDYAKLFELIILEYSSQAGRYQGEFIQPNEVTKFVSALLDGHNIHSAYNPFAGVASYQISNSSVRYYSQEINRSTWILGKIRLFLNDIDSTNYVCEDSMENWQRNKFDAVISSPPFGIRIDPNRYYYTNGQHYAHRDYESFYIDYALNSITVNGVVSAIVPLGFLFKSGSMAQEFRRYILDSGYVQKVILLPDNIFYNTAVKCAVVILTKEPNDGVVMVDGSTFFKKEGRQNVLKNVELLDAIKKLDSSCVKRVSAEEITANGFNLNPAIYVNTVSDVIDIPEGFELKKLRDLVSVYRGERVDNLNARYVRGKDLSEGQHSFEKTFEDLPVEPISQRCTLLGKDLLLVLKIANLKPTYFHHLPSIDVCCNTNILTFDFKEGIYPQYLVNELGKDYVTKQIAARSGGGVMPFITSSNLLEIEILVPDLQTQKILFENDKNNYLSLKAKELVGEELTERLFGDFIDELRIKRHSLRQYLAAITSGVSALGKYVEKHNLGERSFSEVLNMTLADHINNLSTTVDEMDAKLDLLTQTKSFGAPDRVNILTELRKVKSTVNYKVEHFFKAHRGLNYIVSINTNDFSGILNDIISNAVMHGFASDSIGNIIRIECDYDIDDNMYVIRISNNGKPMPKGMDSRRYGIKGEVAGKSGNEGIGGYRVKSVVEHFKGSYSVDNDENSLFPVQIMIKLPKID